MYPYATLPQLYISRVAANPMRYILYDAVYEGDLPRLQATLARNRDLANKPVDGVWPIIIAAERALPILQALLAAGASPNVRDSFSQDTPLHIAIASGRDVAQKVIAMLKAGADINALNSRKYTPLNIAINTGDAEIVRLLLARGATTSNYDWERKTPLHQAAGIGNLDVVLALLNAQDPNVQNREQKTPLHFAAYSGYLDLVQALLAAGANPNAPAEVGTPLHEAVNGGHRDVVQVVKELLAAGANPNAPSGGGDTPLHSAVFSDGIRDMEQLVQVIQDLLTARANPNAFNDYYHETPLHLAARKRNGDIMWILMRAGGNPDLSNFEGNTPLHLAAEFNNVTAVQAMLRAGAQPTLINKLGQTPLDLARAYGNKEVAAVLEQEIPYVAY